MEITGIDVSEWQGAIDWKKVAKTGIKFAILRVGYGNNNIDEMFQRNVSECEKNNIPYGVYWFSYAYTPALAANEGECVANLLKNHNPIYPIFFDFEEDSARYAKNKGVTVNASLLCEMAEAFIMRVNERGYEAGIYTNPDFINRGYKNILNKNYPLWLAHWGSSKPSYTCNIWQYTDQGKVSGISGSVDLNKCYTDIGTTPDEELKEPADKYSEIWEDAKQEYAELAELIIAGKYGNGETRKKRILEMGYDYQLVQRIVTEMLK